MFEKHYRKANNAISASREQKENLIKIIHSGEKRTVWGLPRRAVYTTAACLVIVLIAAFLIPQIPKQPLPTGPQKPIGGTSQQETEPESYPDFPIGATDPTEPSQGGQAPVPKPDPGRVETSSEGTYASSNAGGAFEQPTNSGVEPPTPNPEPQPTGPQPSTDPPQPPPTNPGPDPEPTDPWDPPTLPTSPGTDCPTDSPPPTDPTEPSMPIDPTVPTEPDTEAAACPTELPV